MCTVSWVHQPGGYHLLCNRDEKRTRGVAAAPQVSERDGVRYIAPVDPQAGGTWITVNEAGVSLCLLNGESVTPAASEFRSRGLLLHDLVSAPSAAECISWAQQLDLAPFAPFTLLMLEPEVPATVARWDGTSLTIDRSADAQMPLTSSSYDAEGARRVRRAEFERRIGAAGRVDSGLLYWLHASHGSGPGAYSTCMHRDDAETVSFSWIIVSPEQIRFLYSPASPCQWSPSEQQILTRAA